MKGIAAEWLLYSVIITAIAFLIVSTPLLSTASDAMDVAVSLQARYLSQNIAGVINEMQSGPDGMSYNLILPKQGMIKIYSTKTIVDIGGDNKYTSYFMQKETPVIDMVDYADGNNPRQLDEYASIDIDASKISKITFFKSSGVIKIIPNKR